jgi:hypothetical protein
MEGCMRLGIVFFGGGCLCHVAPCRCMTMIHSYNILFSIHEKLQFCKLTLGFDFFFVFFCEHKILSKAAAVPSSVFLSNNWA